MCLEGPSSNILSRDDRIPSISMDVRMQEERVDTNLSAACITGHEKNACLDSTDSITRPARLSPITIVLDSSINKTLHVYWRDGHSLILPALSMPLSLWRQGDACERGG